MKSVISWQILPECRPMRGVGGLVFAFFASVVCADAADTDEGVAFFEKRIRPVLVEKCYQCHAADAKKIKGGLLLDTREGIRQGGDTGPAVVPSDTKGSLLLTAIRYTDQDLEMPPKERLPAEVVEDFEKWIAMGAPDPRGGKAVAKASGIDLEEGRKFWSFQPISNPPVPAPKDHQWARADIDRFILAGLEGKGLKPVGDADRVTLIRRVTFDLTGLPPTPEEVDAFIQDGSPRAFEALVDRLLESPRFGERWGRHWLDVARYAESSGSAWNVPFPLAFRYRDYVIDAFNKDKPYDQFIREQLAGDLLPAASDAQRNEQLVATGFLTVGVKDLRERNSNHRYIMSIVEEQIDTTSRAMLGLTIACARCHDHKFDPIPTRDYYALAGIFSSTEPLLGVMRPNFADPLAAGVQPLAGRAVSFTDKDTASLLKQWVERNNMRLGILDERRRVLMAADKLKATEKEQNAICSAAPTVRELQKKLAAFDESNRALVARYDAALPHSAMAVREAKPADCAVHIRGEDTQLGDVVPRGFPAVLTTAASPKVNFSQSGRRELAEWIASPQNPLAARVMVNRIWQHLMGAGLVETPDDFGKTGQEPSHPALLDHLAHRFLAHGWSVKKLVREIALSRVYQLASTHQSAADEADPANRLRWRMNRRRLDANAIRDSVLLISGQLDFRRPPERIQTLIGRLLKSLDPEGWLAAAARHRTVYLPMFREYIPDDLTVFDFPEPELVTGQRDITTVPTQALYLLNSPFIVEQSQKTAERLLAKPAPDDHARVSQAYELILGRPPEAQERANAVTFLEQFPCLAEAGKNTPTAALAALCQTLFASGEFRYLY